MLTPDNEVTFTMTLPLSEYECVAPGCSWKLRSDQESIDALPDDPVPSWRREATLANAGGKDLREILSGVVHDAFQGVHAKIERAIERHLDVEHAGWSYDDLLRWSAEAEAMARLPTGALLAELERRLGWLHATVPGTFADLCRFLLDGGLSPADLTSSRAELAGIPGRTNGCTITGHVAPNEPS